jgi:hypothetical protein
MQNIAHLSQKPTLRAATPPPLPIRAQHGCAPPRCRPTCNVQRSTFNPSRLTPPSPQPPLPVWAQRRCTPPRCPPTFNVQRSTFNPSRLAPPSPQPPLPVRAQRRCTPPRCPPTCNVQRATFNPSRLSPPIPPAMCAGSARETQRRDRSPAHLLQCQCTRRKW